ncbi:TRAP transporter substrate-binding protein [Vineibacter terrae]|uniref:TRAP transporter substrate-binding protein n=2 Tax=Vineibacter terrae TaxID=2586908 RepID=A0A5C8P920_9HYPH|nr:TRAP transporter substrate-binding protein [Vineibacter terrae]TXL70258.1 TRAP transporter substrate-binding protein [Vineibacter terrae]
MIDKIAALAVAGAMALVSTGAAAQTKWDLPAAYPATNFHTVNMQKFADAVKAGSGGKLEITIHPGASLFKAPEIKRAVQTGQAPIGEILISNFENEDPLYGLDVVPFLATSFAEAKKLWQAQKPVLEKKLAAQGMIALFSVPWPPQGLYAKKEVNALADMKGMKFRAYNRGTSRIAELTGAQPITIQAAELSQALATGKVDSFISSGATGVDSKVWEQLTHFYDTQAWLPKDLVLMNKAAFDKLDDATRKVVMAEAAKAEATGWAESERLAKGFLETLAKNGMKVQPPSAKLGAEYKELGKKLTEEWLEKAGADGKSVVEAYRKM